MSSGLERQQRKAILNWSSSCSSQTTCSFISSSGPPARKLTTFLLFLDFYFMLSLKQIQQFANIPLFWFNWQAVAPAPPASIRTSSAPPDKAKAGDGEGLRRGSDTLGFALPIFLLSSWFFNVWIYGFCYPRSLGNKGNRIRGTLSKTFLFIWPSLICLFGFYHWANFYSISMWKVHFRFLSYLLMWLV